MVKYTQEYLEYNNLPNDWHQLQADMLSAAIKETKAPILKIMVMDEYQIEAMLPVLIKYSFSLAPKDIQLYGRELTIYLR